MTPSKSRPSTHTPRANAPARSDADLLLGAWSARALAVGMAGWLLVPALRGYNHYIGWLPFWLLAAPAILLALTHRHRLAAALSAFLVGRRRRRILFNRPQARRASAASRPATVRMRDTRSRADSLRLQPLASHAVA